MVESQSVAEHCEKGPSATAYRMVPIVDLARYRDRGWQVVRVLKRDALMSKMIVDLTDAEIEYQQQRARGG